MIFYDPYDNKPENKDTNPGTETLDSYIEEIDEKTGKLVLRKSGTTNVYKKIQEYAEETDVYNVLRRYAETGDTEILNKRKTFYGDFTKIPSTPIEAINMARKAEKEFEEIDKNVRELFNNDVKVFKKAIMDGTVEEKMAGLMGRKVEQQEQQQEQTVVSEPQSQGVNLNE